MRILFESGYEAYEEIRVPWDGNRSRSMWRYPLPFTTPGWPPVRHTMCVSAIIFSTQARFSARTFRRSPGDSRRLSHRRAYPLLTHCSVLWGKPSLTKTSVLSWCRSRPTLVPPGRVLPTYSAVQKTGSPVFSWILPAYGPCQPDVFGWLYLSESHYQVGFPGLSAVRRTGNPVPIRVTLEYELPS